MRNSLRTLMIIVLVFTSSVAADQVEFFVSGAQGDGLLPGNISPGTSSNGSGNIGATGILFDTDTNILRIDIEWGSVNGYSDLTGEITLLHLHGPTPSLPPFNFGEVNTQILINLGNSLNFNSSASGGGLVDEFFLSNQEADYLLSGRTYINVHTAMYGMGEIRGYVLPVGTAIPEPATMTILLIALLSTAAMRSRNRPPKIDFCSFP